MRTKLEDAGYLSELVKIIWPEHTLEELVEIIASYRNSDNSVVFAADENGQMETNSISTLVVKL